jgi:SAM-dependent methyltransferase
VERDDIEMTDQHGGYEIHEFAAEYYDVAYNRRNNIDVDFFVDYSKKCGGRTLELGCGTGRVLIPTAIDGCQITGLDPSPYMLQKCYEKLERQPEKVRRRVKLIQDDMTDFNIGEKYSLVTLPFRPFQHLISVKEEKACLKCIQRHLKPHGLLVLDVYNPNPAYLFPNSNNPLNAEREDLPETPMPNGCKVRRNARIIGYHKDQQYNDIELMYYVTHPDGK